MKKLVLAATALAFLAGAPAFAQSAAPAAQAPAAAPAAAPATAAPKAAAPRSAASIDCSKQADAKGLHGKDRKKFRSDCKKAAKAN
ncbi:MAG: PsiF family protein [Rhodoblastus sp.]